MTPEDLGPIGLQDPMQIFDTLVGGAGKVLMTAERGNEAFRRAGYTLEVYTRDLRLIRDLKESFDAIWWSDANAEYALDDAFRILQSFFRGLRPKRGVLAVSFRKSSPEREWPLRALRTIFRQTGFAIVHHLENPEEHLFFCQRV